MAIEKNANDVQSIFATLETIGIEMAQKLMRMTNSNTIGEASDVAVAVCDQRGFQLRKRTPGMPRDSGAIAGYVAGIMRSLMSRGAGPAPGDVIIHNDTDAGATANADIGICVPIFFRDELVGFAVTTVRHRDFGINNPRDGTDVSVDGLRFTASKCYERDIRDEALWKMIRDNPGISEQALGVLEAQVEVSRMGAALYCDLLERFGSETMRRVVEDYC